MKRLILFLLLAATLNAEPKAAPTIGAQVFIEPGQSSEETEQWFKLLHDHHMPICRIRMFEEHMRTNDGWDFSLYDRAFDLAEQYNVKIAATLFPSDNTVGGFKFPRSDKHLHTIGEFIDAMVLHFKDHPALQTWVLQNEPGIGSYEHNEFTDKKFSEWQSTQPAKQYTNEYRKESLDWEMFYRDYTIWYLNWIAERVWQQDTAHGTHVNNHALFNNLPQYDFPNWMPFLSSLGASIHAAWHLGYFERQQYTLAITANCDIIHDAAKPKPFWVTELQGGNNIFSGIAPLCPTVQDIEQWLWTSIGSGAESIIFWCLNPRATGPEAGEWAMVTFQNQASDRLVAAGQVAETLQKHADFFADAVPHKSDVTLLYSPESMIIMSEKAASKEFPDHFAGRKPGAHIKSVLAYYEVLQENGFAPQVKQMDHFNWMQKSKTPHTVILANMVCIPNKYVKDLQTFVANGNKLIVTGMSGFFDEYMHNVVQSIDPWKELLGGSLAEYKFKGEAFDLVIDGKTLPAHMMQGEIQAVDATPLSPAGHPVTAVRHQYKNGEVVWIPSLIGLAAWQKDNSALSGLLTKEIRDNFQFPKQKPHVVQRVLRNGKNLVTIYINTDQEEQSIQVNAPAHLAPHVIYGSSPLTSNTLTLAPQQTIVILWK